MKKTWKAIERQICRYFGCERTPLSGSTSRHTKADCLHPRLFIEVKYRQKMWIWELWEKTKKLAKEEKKIPVICLKQKSKKGFLLVIHSEDFKDVGMEFFSLLSSFSSSLHPQKGGLYGKKFNCTKNLG